MTEYEDSDLFFGNPLSRYQVYLDGRTEHSRIWLDDGENTHGLSPEEARELARRLLRAADKVSKSDAPMLGGSHRIGQGGRDET